MQPAPIPDDQENNENLEDEGLGEELDDDSDDVTNNNNNENNGMGMLLPEPTGDDVGAWMSPKRAREKELLLLAQYRRCQKLARQHAYQLSAQKKQREKMANLSLRLKRTTLQVKGLEKIIRDILNAK